MTATDSVRRRPRAAWADLRLLLGLLLILLSVAGVWLVVAVSRQTVPVFAAARTIVAGDRVSTDDLRLVEVALDGADAAYLAPGALAVGAVASRTIGVGELVPAGAVAPGDAGRLARVVVRSDTAVPETVVVGATVELWAAPRRAPGEYDLPRILVPDATVAAVAREDGMLGRAAVSLELVIPRAEVAETLAAVAGEASLSVVATGSGAPR